MFKGFDNITLNDFFKLSSTTLRGVRLKTGINRNQNQVYRNHTLNLRNQLPENCNQPESTEINKNQHQVYVKPTDINRNPRQLCICR